jgi:acetyl-CoA acetyltransferase
MSRNPFSDVAIAGVFNTRQARQLPEETSRTILLQALHGALADAGIGLDEVDGIAAPEKSTPPAQWVWDLGLGPAWIGTGLGIDLIIDAATAIATGQCGVAVVVTGAAGQYTEKTSLAPWTKPENEFVIPWGMITAAEFALVARRHMIEYGTSSLEMATAAAVIRNNGSVNPEAVFFGKGPYTAEDVVNSRMIADPFHLLEVAMVSEGGCAMVLTTADRASKSLKPPVYLWGAGRDSWGPAYQHPPRFKDANRRDPKLPMWLLGRNAADRAFSTANLARDDVDVLEIYDPFSFEIIRQLEAYRFCELGHGRELVMAGEIGPGGRWPVTTDGGTMSFGHASYATQMIQRVVRGVQQLRGECETNQVENAKVALCSCGAPAAMAVQVVLLGSEKPQ